VEKDVSDETTIRETTQPTIANHLVGVSNIWKRDLPDGRGVVANRLSATVTIVDPVTQEARREFVIVGSTFALGAEWYRVVNIDEGASNLGAITVRRIPPPREQP
jgi:hypothetical protein